MELNDCCRNCFREQTELLRVCCGEIRGRRGLCRKHYCNFSFYELPSHGDAVWICLDCRAYLFEGGSCQVYWPAMVWKFLTHSGINELMLTMSLRDRWSLIPQKWRHWWINQFRKYEQHVEIDEPSALFYDVSYEYHDFMGAIERLKWRELGEAMDKYIAYPGVRCPWGCSEFLHRTNLLSLESFLWSRSNCCFSVYSVAKKNSGWTKGIREDFPSSVTILENPEFQCQPSIIFCHEKGPVILACREHSSKTTSRFIHVPRNPTGSLYMDGGNRYAPVSINSRCLRKGKIHAYSDTFRISELRGGYDGMDSMFLNRSIGQGMKSNNSVVNERDVLSILGREDMAYHVQTLGFDPKERNYVPSNFTEDLIRTAEEKRTEFMEHRNLYCKGSTFISLETAIRLQENMDCTGSRMILVPMANGFQEKFFTPCWPQIIIRVHGFDDYGEQFSPIPNLFKKADWHDTNTAIFSCILFLLTTTDELWEMCDRHVSSTERWEGWILSIAASKVLKSDTKGNWPFQAKRIELSELFRKIGGSVHSCTCNFEPLKSLFEDYDKIAVVSNGFHGFESSLQVSTVIIFRDLEDWNNEPFVPLDYLGDWELRMVFFSSYDETNGSEFTTYARHGRKLFSNWWVESSKDCTFRKAMFPLEERDFWDVCVYVNIASLPIETIRDKYLSAIGGQALFYCKQHGIPFVKNCKRSLSFGQIMPCCAPENFDSENNNITMWTITGGVLRCERFSTYICPIIGCSVGLCAEHENLLRKRNACCNREGKFLVNRNCCLFLAAMQELNNSRNEQVIHMSDHAPDSTSFNDIGNDHDITSTQSEDSSAHTNGCESELSSVSSKDLDENQVHAMLGPTRTTELVEELYDGFDFISDDDSGEEDDDETNNEQDLKNISFRTTSAANEVEDFELVCNNEVLNSISLHVLFNKHGHLLVRRRRKLTMSKRNESFFQRIVAMNKTRTIPMVYPEALLFPDCFYLGIEDGSILGAFPTPLWNDDYTLKKFRIASLIDHARVRTRDPSLLCSTDPTYQFFQFDALVNLGLRGSDSRVILHRGLQGLFPDKKDGPRAETSENVKFYGDTIDSKQSVHKLAAAVGEELPHYFYTQSCNQKMSRGLRRLRDWLDSEEAVCKIKIRHPGLPHHMCRKALHESAASFILRSWIEVSHLWLQYIVDSCEMPLGKILKVWYRKEFQDLIAALFHLHCMFWTADDIGTQEGLDKVLGRIRGCIADIIQLDEIEEYMVEQNLSYDVLLEILECAEKFLRHECHARCQVPVRGSNKGDSKEPVKYMCKVPNNPLLTDKPQDHRFVEVQVEHSKEAMEILAELGLIEILNAYDGESDVKIKYLDPALSMIRHVPRCDRRDGIISPVGGKLFVLNPSAQNLQFPTGYSLLRYLTKYVTEVDAVATVHCFPPSPRNENKFRGNVEILNNTKITSVRKQNENAKTSDVNNGKTRMLRPKGRLLSQTEALTMMWGEEVVTTNLEFIHLPTCAREYRATVELMKKEYKNQRRQPFDSLNFQGIPTEIVRKAKQFPPWRLMTDSQITLIQDELNASMKIDVITLFGIRPPELRFVNKPCDYLRWFYQKAIFAVNDIENQLNYAEQNLNRDLSVSEWIDGIGRKVTLRAAAIEPCLKYAESCPVIDFGNESARRQMIGLLKRLSYLYDVFVLNMRGRRRTPALLSSWEKLSERFLFGLTSHVLPVVWMTPVLPKNQNRFLLHLLLGMGRFVCEYDLMLRGNTAMLVLRQDCSSHGMPLNL